LKPTARIMRQQNRIEYKIECPCLMPMWYPFFFHLFPFLFEMGKEKGRHSRKGRNSPTAGFWRGPGSGDRPAQSRESKKSVDKNIHGSLWFFWHQSLSIG
jgi:hypothetical protein